MKCSYCGTEFEGNFCINCGARAGNSSSVVFNNVDSAGQYPKNGNYITPAGDSGKKKKHKKPFYKRPLFIIAAIAVIVITLGKTGDKINDKNIINTDSYYQEQVKPSAPEKTSEAKKTKDSGEKKTEAAATEKKKEAEKKTELIDGMRPEFKKAMDAYLEYFKDLSDIIRTCQSDPTGLSSLAGLTDALVKLEKIENELDAWDEDEMNDTEIAYFIKVNAKCQEMFADASLY